MSFVTLMTQLCVLGYYGENLKKCGAGVVETEAAWYQNQKVKFVFLVEYLGIEWTSQARVTHTRQ